MYRTRAGLSLRAVTTSCGGRWTGIAVRSSVVSGNFRTDPINRPRPIVMELDLAGPMRHARYGNYRAYCSMQSLVIRLILIETTDTLAASRWLINFIFDVTEIDVVRDFE